MRKNKLIGFLVLIAAVLFITWTCFSAEAKAEPEADEGVKAVFVGDLLFSDMLKQFKTGPNETFLIAEENTFTEFREKLLPKIEEKLAVNPEQPVFLTLTPEKMSEEDLKKYIDEVKNAENRFAKSRIYFVTVPVTDGEKSRKKAAEEYNRLLKASGGIRYIDLCSYLKKTEHTPAKDGTFRPLDLLIAYEYLLREAGIEETTLKYAGDTLYPFEKGLYLENFSGMYRYQASGEWYLCSGGKVDFGYNGFYKIGKKTYYIMNSRLRKCLNRIVRVKDKMILLQDSQKASDYIGVFTDGTGSYYVNKGEVDTGFSGSLTENGKEYQFKNGFMPSDEADTPETQPETETEPETTAESSAETEPETTTVPETETEPETEPVTETEAETEPATETEAETEPVTETETATDVEQTVPETPPAGNSSVEELHAMHAVYLTFDDGPSAECTPYVLDLLDQYGVKACFFVTLDYGNADLYREIVNRGHMIGVHTAHHEYETLYASFDNWLQDFTATYQFIQEFTGVTPVLYRFPGGSNTHYPSAETKQQIVDYLHSIGCEYYDWNVVMEDGDQSMPVEQIYSNVFDTIDARVLPVILCHDGEGFQNSMQALPQVLETLLNRGYQFRRLEAGVPVIQQGSHWDY